MWRVCSATALSSPAKCSFSVSALTSAAPAVTTSFDATMVASIALYCPTVRVSVELEGSAAPTTMLLPEAPVTSPSVPEPFKVVPVLMVTAEAILPLTSKRPSFREMAVAKFGALLLRISAEAPCLLRVVPAAPSN